jgi:fucose permease
VIVITAFFFFYVGTEVGFGGWISTFALMGEQMTETEAAYGTSVFWVAITAGRLGGVFLSQRYTTMQQLNLQVPGCVASALLMILFLLTKQLRILVYFGGLVFGLLMSSIFPLAMSIQTQFKMSTTS